MAEKRDFVFNLPSWQVKISKLHSLVNQAAFEVRTRTSF